MNPILQWLQGLMQPASLEERVNGAYKRGVVGRGATKKNNSAAVGVPPWLDALYKSPVADSLYQTSEIPKYLGNVNKKDYPEANGIYNTFSDYVGLDANEKDMNDPRRTLIHEMGHKYRAYNKDYKNSPAYTPTNIDIFEAIRTPDKTNSKATLKLDPYYVSDPNEGYAQAFVNAFNFLSETALKPDMDYRKFAGDLEGNTPGMGMIVQDLMKLPIFAKHPLQGQIFREGKK